MSSQPAILNTLLKYYLATAKSELSTEDFSKLDIKELMRFLQLLSSYIPSEHLTDSNLIKHSIEQLNNQSVEAAVLHIFLLSMYKMSIDSDHPLEHGVIKQKIIHALPAFEKAMQTKLIHKDMYDRNIDALLHMSENTPELDAIHQALAIEYQRLATC